MFGCEPQIATPMPHLVAAKINATLATIIHSNINRKSWQHQHFGIRLVQVAGGQALPLALEDVTAGLGDGARDGSSGSGNPRVLHLTVAGSGAFLHMWFKPEPDPRRTGFGCGFHFSPVGALQNLEKKPETQKNSKPERNSFTKPDRFGFGVKFNPNSTRCHP
jgi:hypothetical protein